MSDLFITLHDMSDATRRKPEGRPIRVRASSIDSLRGYDDGLVRCVVTVHGVHHHVAETADHIEAMVRPSMRR